MSKQSGFMKRQADKTEDLSIKVQFVTRQFMIDTLQIALHKEFGWGFDRLIRLAEVWEDIRKECQPAIEPRNPMCDVKQEHMQRVFEDICKKKMKPIPFQERYLYLKEVRYERKRK